MCPLGLFIREYHQDLKKILQNLKDKPLES